MIISKKKYEALKDEHTKLIEEYESLGYRYEKLLADWQKLYNEYLDLKKKDEKPKYFG